MHWCQKTKKVEEGDLCDFCREYHRRPTALFHAKVAKAFEAHGRHDLAAEARTLARNMLVNQ